MTSDVATQTLQEHEHLLSVIDELVAGLRKLPADVRWGNSTWAQDTEILDFIQIQILSLQNAKNNAVCGCYRDVYHLIRMVFEGYFILRLVSTCDKYPYRVHIKRTAGDSSLDDAKNKIIEKAHRHFGSRLIRTYMEDKTLVCVLRGIPVVDDKGNDTGRVVPYYYRAWHQFRPLEHHLKRTSIQDKWATARFLSGEWAGFPQKTKLRTNEYDSAVYKYFLTFDKILENLRLNGILSKKTTTRVLVHYNFLSNFSHSTSDSLSTIRGRIFYPTNPDGRTAVYDHYLSELALLYVCHLGRSAK